MVDKRPRGRRSAEQTRADMLDAGIAQLARDGVKYGLDHLTLEAACQVADVPRSSSHAAWSTDEDFTPQAKYQRAVLERWIQEFEGTPYAAAATEALVGAAESGVGELSRGEIVRIAIQATLEAAVEPAEDGVGSGALSTDLALKHALASQPIEARDPGIAKWVRDSEVSQRDNRVRDTYRPVAELLGVRPRAEFGDDAFQHISIAIAALLEGVAMRHLVIPDRDYAHTEITDPDQGPTTLLAVCVEALFDRFFEPIDGHDGSQG